MTDESDRRITRRDLLRAGAIGTAAALAGCSGGDSGSDRDGDSGGGGDGDPGSDGDGEPDDGSDPDSGEDSGADEGTDAGDGGEPESDADGSPDDQQPDREEPERDIPHASEYGTVVDVVADGGADPNGEETIAPVLDAHAGDDTLLFFPSGEYLLDDVWQLPSFEHLGVVGDDATIVPREGYDGYLFVFGFPDRDAADLLFEGIDFDFTAPNTAPRPLQAQIDDGIDVRSVTVRGRSGTARFDVTAEDGSGTVRNLVLADGGREPNPVGVLVGPANRGELRFENCHVEGFPGNGLYASPSNGPIEVVGGEYANNGIASIRVSSPATVRDVHVRCDEAPDGFRNMRGIRLRHGAEALVENCTVEMTDLTYSDGAVVVEPMMESATIRDVDIELSVDEVPAINARTPEIERASTSGNDGTSSDDADPAADTGTTNVECRRVTVTGDAARGAAVKLVDRDGCQLRDVDISQSGAGRDGVHLIRSSESILRNSEIEVTGESLVLEQSEVERINTRL